MRIRSHQVASSRSGGLAAFTLIECMVYVAVFFLLLGMAFMTYYRADQNSRNLRANAADILRTLKAGERWREDIRLASSPLQPGGSAEEPELTITQTNTVIKYTFRQGTVWRRAGQQQAPILTEVLRSTMAKDPRRFVSGWRWEVELKTRKKPVRVKPLFTFLAVGKEVAK